MLGTPNKSPAIGGAFITNPREVHFDNHSLAAIPVVAVPALVHARVAIALNKHATIAIVARIENGLLPAVTIKGQPAPKMTVADRMKVHHTPGVSVAFFDHGQLSWTRTYGFSDLATTGPLRYEFVYRAEMGNQKLFRDSNVPGITSTTMFVPSGGT